MVGQKQEDMGVAEIASKLTEAQRRFVTGGELNLGTRKFNKTSAFPPADGMWTYHPVEQRGAVAVQFTPLGLSVRNYLKENGL